MVLYMFLETHPCVSRPMQFKPMLFEGQLQQEKKWRASGGAAWWRWVWGWKGRERLGTHHDPHPELMQGRKALRCHLSNIVPVQVSGCAQASVQEQCRHPGLIREDRYGSLGSLR